MNESYKLEEAGDMIGLNNQIAQTQKRISDLQAELVALQHRKGQMYVQSEKMQEREPETLLKVVHRTNDNPNVGIEWVCEFTGRARQTIYGWANKRIIPHTKKGRRLSFDKNEIKDWWNDGRRKTVHELEQEALLKLSRS